jgi:hypothetical protein
LSNHVLRLMRKGTTALRNIQLLKWAQEYNIIVEWNVLYGFPGETAEDYRHMLGMLPAVRFLRAPCAVGPIRLDRFSPYHNEPVGFGLVNVRALSTYRYLYPFDDASLNRIAYYFDFDYYSNIKPSSYAADVIDYVTDWKANPDSGMLWAIGNGNGQLLLFDTRQNAAFHELKLMGYEREVYEFCDELRPVTQVVKHLRQTFPAVEFDEQRVRGFLDSLVANRLMVTDEDCYLSLALRAHPLAQNKRERSSKPASSYLKRELKVLAASAG